MKTTTAQYNEKMERQARKLGYINLQWCLFGKYTYSKKTSTQIGQLLGVPSYVILNRLAKYNIPMRPKPDQKKEWPEFCYEQDLKKRLKELGYKNLKECLWVEYVEKGKPTRKVGAMLDRSQYFVKCHAKRYGIKMRPKGGANNIKKAA